MPQQENDRKSGKWHALLLGPNPNVWRDLIPHLSRIAPALTKHEFPSYPARHEIPELLRSHAVSLCLIDVSTGSERALALIPDLLRHELKLAIIAVLSEKNSDLILRCLRQGAADFLIQPFTQDQVELALQKIARAQSALNGAAAGKVFCVMPAKGGCGGSTIACNLAYQWKRIGSKQVLLADLDPLTGIVSFLLKVKSNYSFVDALQRSGDIDADLWKAMVTNRQGVDVLLAPEMMIEGLSDLTDATPIIEYARNAYEVVILDPGGVYGEWNLSQAQRADEVLLVTTNELTALQAAQRATNYLEANGVGDWKIKLIVNRYNRQVGLSRDVIGTALHKDIYYVLPSDDESLQKSLMEGKPIHPATNFGKSMIGLADRLAGREEVVKKSSSLFGLKSLFSRTSS